MEANNIKTIEANGLTFGYFEQGTGPLVICVHGFPDTAHTWQHLMPILAQDGYRVVAPFTRGIPPTSFAKDGDYSGVQLGADIGALITALGADEAIVIGHDWGALAGYAAANLYPEKITKLVAVAIPHPRTLRFTPQTLWRSRHFLTFQFKPWIKWRLPRNHFAFVDSIYKRWSPTWPFTPADTEQVKKTYAQPGAVEGALGYYWSFAANRNNQEVQKVLVGKTAVATLCIVGDADGALDVEVMPQTSKAFTGSYAYKIISQVGHFPHREKPDEFAALVLDYLKT